jgi:hypothetical protein
MSTLTTRLLRRALVAVAGLAASVALLGTSAAPASAADWTCYPISQASWICYEEGYEPHHQDLMGDRSIPARDLDIG